MSSKKIIAFLNSYTQGISGGDLAFIETARRMNDFSFIIITSYLGEKLCRSYGLKAKYILTSHEHYFKRLIITYLKRIFNAVRLNLSAFSVDAVYASSDCWPDVIPAFFIKRTNPQIKWIQKIFHLIPPNRILSHYVQKISLKIIKHWADLVIVDNIILKNDLIKKNFSEHNMITLPLGVDLKYIQSLDKIPNHTFDAIFVGRLHISKGIFDLLDIWNLVHRRKPNARLAIVGDGNLRRKLETEINRRNLRDCIFVLGYQAHDTALRIMKTSKLLIFPSHEEGFGLSIVEAMAVGIPVLAWDLPSYRVNFKNGILTIPKGDIKNMSSAVLELLDDANKYLYWKNRGFKNSLRFDWETIAQNEKTLINRQWEI